MIRNRAAEAAFRRFGVIAKSAVSPWVAALAALGGLRLAMMVVLPFSDTTEARYGEIARKMLETGDWITPQFDYGVPFWGKPPLHTWMSALGMGTFGVSEFGGRLFIFLSSLVILTLIFYWIKTLFDTSLALASTTVLASSVLFFGAAGFVMTDIPMTLGITLSMIGFFQCMTKGSSQWGRLAFLGIAIGLLAKGPVALVISVIPLLLWSLTGQRQALLQRLPWVSGTVVVFAVALPWYVLAELKTPGFLNYFIVGEHFERFVVPDWQGDLYGSGHEKPKGMIWLYALAAFMPWTLFGFAIPRDKLIPAFRCDASGLKTYLVFWILSPLILFTFAANILAAYVLPAMPAAACLGVVLWRETKPSFQFGYGAICVAIATTTFLGLGLLFLGIQMPKHPKLRAEHSLVTTLQTKASDAELHYWRYRSYSAEFYRNGNVFELNDLKTVDGLSKNSTRDAIAVRPRDLSVLANHLQDAYVFLGGHGRYMLFLEKSGFDE